MSETGVGCWGWLERTRHEGSEGAPDIKGHDDNFDQLLARVRKDGLPVSIIRPERNITLTPPSRKPPLGVSYSEKHHTLIKVDYCFKFQKHTLRSSFAEFPAVHKKRRKLRVYSAVQMEQS